MNEARIHMLHIDITRLVHMRTLRQVEVLGVCSEAAKAGT